MLKWDLTKPGLFALAALDVDATFHVELLKKGQVARYSGAEKSFSLLMQELLGGDLFSKPPLLLVSHSESFSEKELQSLTEFAAHFDVQSGVRALFSFNSLQKKPVRAFFEAISHRHSFLQEKPWERTSRQRAELLHILKNRGYSMTPDALERFDALELDPLVRLREVEKLITYALDRKTLTAEDVDILCQGGGGASAWKLFDLWLEKKPAKMVELIAAAANDTSTLLGLVFPLRHQIAQSAAVLEGRSDYLEKKYPYLSGMRLKKSREKLLGIEPRGLMHLYRQLIDFELLVKRAAMPLPTLRSMLALLLRGEAWAS